MVAPNDILGYYRMLEKIGAGGMGEVWKAEDTRLGRTVAVKILPPAIASDQEAIARMRREARTAAQINSPNIATIYSFEEIGERLFIVMEFVEGDPLTKLIARGPMPEAELCRIGHEVAEALAEAHAKGIIHRDIKPDNIIVSGRRVKVLDFGIAKQISTNIGPGDPTAYLTQQGMIVGTVNYMSPEQALGKGLDPRTDIFSLGIVLYQAATGKLPFKGETMTETITQIVRDEPSDPMMLNRSLSPGLAKIIARCLRKPREQRFESAADLAAALETQMAKAATSPMTRAEAKPAAASVPAAPTVLTGSKLRTVVEAPPKKNRTPAVVFAALVVLALLVAIGAISRAKRPPAPAKTPPPVTKTNPQSTATVTAIAPGPTATAADVPAATSSAPATVPETASPLAGTQPPATTTTAATTTSPQKPPSEQLFADGLTNLQAGREGEARRLFVAAMAADPQNRKARLGLAIANHNWPKAKQLAREIQRENPDDPDVAALRQFVAETQPQPPPPRPFRRRQH